ncbi:MAG: 2-C-methyl-D-erythritol 4-phosphate cytidylyltransferase [Mycolicibacterium sp.]|uniref:IspD/TarI family cytidylyltransferase n=1 Tax=Mycolicibacterium sp. TaxID=2320850 RepID=UPI003D0B492E
MTVTAIVPVPAGLAERPEAVVAAVAGLSPLARIVRTLAKRCDVVVATAAAVADPVHEALAAQEFSSVRKVVATAPGERAQCVEAGLRGLVDGDAVVVHHIDWPLVGIGTLDRVIAALSDGAVAVMPATQVTDSVKTLRTDGSLSATLDRSRLRAVQYPRGFSARALASLVKSAGSSPFDELEVVLSTGTPLNLIEGDEEALRVELPTEAGYLAAVIQGSHDRAGR